MSFWCTGRAHLPLPHSLDKGCLIRYEIRENQTLPLWLQWKFFKDLATISQTCPVPAAGCSPHWLNSPLNSTFLWLLAGLRSLPVLAAHNMSCLLVSCVLVCFFVVVVFRFVIVCGYWQTLSSCFKQHHFLLLVLTSPHLMVCFILPTQMYRRICACSFCWKLNK